MKRNRLSTLFALVLLASMLLSACAGGRPAPIPTMPLTPTPFPARVGQTWVEFPYSPNACLDHGSLNGKLQYHSESYNSGLPNEIRIALQIGDSPILGITAYSLGKTEVQRDQLANLMEKEVHLEFGCDSVGKAYLQTILSYEEYAGIEDMLSGDFDNWQVGGPTSHGPYAATIKPLWQRMARKAGASENSQAPNIALLASKSNIVSQALTFRFIEILTPGQYGSHKGNGEETIVMANLENTWVEIQVVTMDSTEKIRSEKGWYWNGQGSGGTKLAKNVPIVRFGWSPTTGFVRGFVEVNPGGNFENDIRQWFDRMEALQGK